MFAIRSAFSSVSPCISSYCSLRCLVKFLPNGPPAPRLSFNLNKTDSADHLTDSYSSTEDSDVSCTSSYYADDCDIDCNLNNLQLSPNYKVPVHYVGSFSKFATSTVKSKPKRCTSSVDGRKRKITNFNESDQELDARELKNSDRIKQLEDELSSLRTQLAQIIMNQQMNEKLGTHQRSVCLSHRLDADGASDTSQPTEENGDPCSYPTQTKNESVVDAYPPPPPPPPPFKAIPRISQPNWRDQLVEKLKAKNNNNAKTSSPNVSPVNGFNNNCAGGGMSEVLHELQSGAFKLRSVPRSPGGTPIRSKKPVQSKPFNPCEVINEALMKRIAHLRSVIETSGSTEEHVSSTSDSFEDFSPFLKSKN